MALFPSRGVILHATVSPLSPDFPFCRYLASDWVGSWSGGWGTSWRLEIGMNKPIFDENKHGVFVVIWTDNEINLVQVNQIPCL